MIVIWDNFFEKFLPSFPWKVKSSKIFKKNQKRFKFPKMPKIVPKSIQTCFGRVWGKLSENFCPVFHGMSSLQKFSKKIFSKFQKCPKSFPKVSKRVLNVFWGKFFENFFAQCSVEGQVFEKFQSFYLKFQKCPKVFPKVSKRVLNMFCGKSFGKFLPSFRWKVESSKIFKIFFFQNSKNAQKCSQKNPNVF